MKLGRDDLELVLRELKNQRTQASIGLFMAEGSIKLVEEELAKLTPKKSDAGISG